MSRSRRPSGPPSTRDDYADRFLGGRREFEPLDDEDARQRLERLRQAFRQAQPQAVVSPDTLADGFPEFIGRSEAFLADLAKRHEYDYTPLLTG